MKTIKLFFLFISICACVKAQWVLQQVPTTNELRDVYFADSTQGWVTALYDGIFHTTDGGYTWEQQYPAIAFHLSGLSNTELWATGRKDTLLHTTNGGEFWTKITINEFTDFDSTQYIATVYFYNSSIGWIHAVGWRFGSYDAHFLKTTNGGLSWVIKDPPFISDNSFIQFFNSMEGVYTGSSMPLYKTIDGGDNWAILSGPGYMATYGMQFVTSNIGWITTDGPVGITSVVKTTDGGLNWFSSIFCFCYLLHPYFVDTLKGWSVKIDQVIHTSDGGINWNFQYTYPPSFSPEKIFFADTSNGWIIGNDGLILHTSTGGVGNPIPGPAFLMYPNSLNFGEVVYGQSETLPVYVKNIGFLDSLIINNAISFDSSFTFEPNIFPIILAPEQMQIFNITYTGNIIGEHIDSILFFHNAPGSPGKLIVRAETSSPPNQNCASQILCEVLVTDNISAYSRSLKFGLDSSATDNIDPQLGESELPPFPPPGAFEAQLFLPENNFTGTLRSYCDFRCAVLPYTGQKEWRLAYQTGYGNTINISWDFPSYMTGVLQDIINGTIINVPMTDSGGYTVQNPYVFDRLRMIIDFDIEVPVELVSFNAILLDNSVSLDWSTATETNNSGFTVERISIPNPKFEFRNSNWNEIGFVPGFGTTTEPKSYSFTDEDVTTGTYKYRLKQIDFDGTFTYSNEIEVYIDFTPKEFVLYQNYPNPFNPSTIIKFEIPDVETTRQVVFTTLKVYDVLGNEVATLVNEEKQSGVYEVEFNAASISGSISAKGGYASGVYFYQLLVSALQSKDGKAGIFTDTKKMVLIK